MEQQIKKKIKDSECGVFTIGHCKIQLTQWWIFVRVDNSTKWVEINVKSFLSSTGYNS